MSTEISSNLKSSFEDYFGDRVSFNTLLAPYLAYRVGGPAEILVFPHDESDLQFIADTAKRFQIPITIVGNGTNLLVVDDGIRGIVISLSQAFQEIDLLPSTHDKIQVQVGGGVGKSVFLEWAMERGLTGLEFSAGVPGTIGGGIFMNAGTKYGSYGDILKSIRVFDFRTGAQTLNRENVHFGYRHQTALKDSLLLHATFELSLGEESHIREEVARIITERAAKQPLDFPSCGSTFKNPENHSAGRLIEKAGLKGLRVGGAEVSEKHANFILNRGDAAARDILSLIHIVQATVERNSGVSLECEVIRLGPEGKLVL